MAKPETEVNKAEAIRDALSTLGFGAPLDEVVQWINDKYGVNINKQYISTQKQSYKKQTKISANPKTFVTRSEPVYLHHSESSSSVASNLPVREIAELIAAINTAKRAIGVEGVRQIVEEVNKRKRLGQHTPAYPPALTPPEQQRYSLSY